MSHFKSVRLSNAIREDIKQAMLNAWTIRNPIPFDLTEMSNHIADAIWKKHYGKLPLDKIPKSMFKTANSVKIQIAGSVQSFRMSQERPYEIEGGYTEAILEVHDENLKIFLNILMLNKKCLNGEKLKKSLLKKLLQFLIQ